MGEIIALLDGYFCSPEYNFDRQHAGVFREFRSARDARAMEAKELARISCAGNDNRSSAHSSGFAAQSLATTVKRPGAVSSVVERLVYSERLTNTPTLFQVPSPAFS